MRSDLQRLRDARRFAEDARYHAGGLGPDILEDATQPRHATLYALAMVGEALGKIPGDIRSAAPDIPWNAIVALRNRIIHGYWQIDPTLVSGVIEHRLFPLMDALDRLIVLVEQDPP